MGAAMKTAKRFGLLLDLLLLATSLAGGGPIAVQLRIISLVVASMVGALTVFCAVVLTIAVLQQRQPPYEM
jgi:hypothetical protein